MTAERSRECQGRPGSARADGLFVPATATASPNWASPGRDLRAPTMPLPRGKSNCVLLEHGLYLSLRFSEAWFKGWMGHQTSAKYTLS